MKEAIIIRRYRIKANNSHSKLKISSSLTRICFPQDTQHSFRYLLIKYKIDNFRFHDLRHSCASYLVQAKVPLLNVAHHLGQKDYNSVLRYAHLAEDVTEETGSIVAARIYGNQ